MVPVTTNQENLLVQNMSIIAMCEQGTGARLPASGRYPVHRMIARFEKVNLISYNFPNRNIIYIYMCVWYFTKPHVILVKSHEIPTFFPFVFSQWISGHPHSGPHLNISWTDPKCFMAQALFLRPWGPEGAIGGWPSGEPTRKRWKITIFHG